MRESFLRLQYPLLSNFKPTSEPTADYNCICWAAGNTERNWDPDPDYFWPEDAKRGYEVGDLVELFHTLGYEICSNVSRISGIEKIAIYARDGRWKHAARQLSTGNWTSKLGTLDDIEHETLEEITFSPDNYGFVVAFMQRPVQG